MIKELLRGNSVWIRSLNEATAYGKWAKNWQQCMEEELKEATVLDMELVKGNRELFLAAIDPWTYATDLIYNCTFIFFQSLFLASDFLRFRVCF